MKKLISTLSAVALTMTMLPGFTTTGEAKETDKLSIVTTIFPEYDWVREITKGNEKAEITMLLDKGVDLHSFQPTADDLVKVSSCDMFIYVGGESDEWVTDALEEAINKDMVVINLLDALGDAVKEEELVEGMEGEEEEGEEEGPEYDEHVWLSLKNTEVLCQYISDELCTMDLDHKDLYEGNTEAYISELALLDQEYETAANNASLKTVLFGDRFPFRYMVDELSLPAILQIESADGKIAEMIKETTEKKNQQILTMDSMQSVTAKDVEEGASYLEIMKNNLSVLSQSIN